MKRELNSPIHDCDCQMHSTHWPTASRLSMGQTTVSQQSIDPSTDRGLKYTWSFLREHHNLKLPSLSYSQPSADCWPTVILTTSCWSTVHWLLVKKMLADCQSTHRPTVGRLLVDCWSTISQWVGWQSADSGLKYTWSRCFSKSAPGWTCT